MGKYLWNSMTIRKNVPDWEFYSNQHLKINKLLYDKNESFLSAWFWQFGEISMFTSKRIQTGLKVSIRMKPK